MEKGKIKREEGSELRVSVSEEGTEHQILCWGCLIFLLKIYRTWQHVGSLNLQLYSAKGIRQDLLVFLCREITSWQ